MRSDLGHDEISAEYRWRAFNNMLACPRHLFIIPTKRPQNFVGIDAPPNAWLLISVEDQATADERLKHLPQLRFPVVGVSLEPMLGPVSFRWGTWDSTAFMRPQTDHLDGLRMLKWVVLGGESGPGARPMRPDWARAVRDQCAEAGIAYLHKQNGEWLHNSQGVVGSGAAYLWPDNTTSIRVGKHKAGRLLDGVQHDGWPEVSHA